MHPILFFYKVQNHILRKCKFHLYNYIAKLTLKARHVKFNPHKIRFTGKCYIDIHPQSYVEIGDDFIVNSGPTSSIDCGIGSKLSVQQGGGNENWSSLWYHKHYNSMSSKNYYR